MKEDVSMKNFAKALFLVASLLAVSGCMNFYVRCPLTEEKIHDTY